MIYLRLQLFPLGDPNPKSTFFLSLPEYFTPSVRVYCTVPMSMDIIAASNMLKY